jgi:DNA polymerase I
MNRREKEGIITWDVKGRLIIDAWASVRKELHPKRETLGYVSAQLFKDTKDNINSSKIDQEWANRKQEVVDYCLKDCELALRILIHPKINSLNKFMDVAIPAKLPIKETAGGQTRLIESVLIRMADRENFAVPCNNNEPYEYEGAFVVDSIVGFHEWVIGLDFSSMYPSQMIKNNICFSTYAKDRSIPEVHISPPIDKDGMVTAAFLPKHVRMGIIPRMVKGFLDSRKEAKKLMKQYHTEGDKDKEDYYDRLQKAVKVMANATYGYFGTQRCRWPYNQYIAPSITAWAREDIHKVKSALESEGCTVVAGDTDSVMFKNPKYQTLEACKKYGLEKQAQFTSGDMKIELEKVMATFFTWAKKRYFGKIVYPEEELIQRGAETRRTDSFDLQSETLEEIFKLVLDNKADDAKKLAKDAVQKTLRGEYGWERYVQAKTVKEFGAYKNPRAMAGVQTAQKLMDAGQEFIPGMKYAYVVVNSRAKPIRVEPVIEGVEFKFRPDYRYYAERLAKSFSRVTFAFGMGMSDLLSTSTQRSLFAFDDMAQESSETAATIDEPEIEEKEEVEQDLDFDDEV